MFYYSHVSNYFVNFFSSLSKLLAGKNVLLSVIMYMAIHIF